MPKVLLTCIFRDDSEYPMIERMLASFMPHVHGLAVAVTGLSGKHEKITKLVKKYKGRIVYTEPVKYPKIYSKDEDGKWFFSNFAEARNVSFALADEMNKDKEFDYYMWADADDVLMEGHLIDSIATRGKELNADAIFVNYWYSCIVKDNKITGVTIEHLRERFLKPHVFKWISRLHEVAVPLDDAYKPVNIEYKEPSGPQLVWAHLPSNERMQSNLRRNLQILELQAIEQERKDPRTLFYIAKTYVDLAEIDKKPELYTEAINLFEEYLKTSGWAEERSNACQYIGNIYGKIGDHRRAVDQYHRAIAEYPIAHLNYLYLSKEYAELGLDEQANHWLETALKMNPPQARTTIGNPLEVKVVAASLKYNQAMKKQDIPDAIHWLKVRNSLLQIEDDGMVKVLEESKAMNDAAHNIFNYARWLKSQGHYEQIEKLLESIAPEMKQEQFVRVIANEVQEPKKWSDKSIVYYCASQFAPWNPFVDEGLGGSESAVKYLSMEWVKLGYEVTVYANVEREGEHNGVVYKHWSSLNSKDDFNILILWRNVGALDIPWNAKKIFVDLHDVTSNLDFTPERIKAVDNVFVKSVYHRSMLPSVPDEKVNIISNGI